MKYTTLFPKTQRHAPKEEVSRNAQLLEQAGYTSKLFAGVYTYLPLGLRVLKKIEHIIREEINNAGGQELFMPALHPQELYEQTGRSNIDVLFHLEMANGKKVVLGQSHEEVIVPLVKKYINSYKDLPLYLYQIQTKFRNELRAKSGILRGREFMMKDLYSFHADPADLDTYYEIMKTVYSKIFERVGLGTETYITFASGGTFSQFSHEFQTITSAGEDTIHLCTSCRIGVNHEIIAEHPTCPACGSDALEEKKSIEVGNIFPLKTKYADAFRLTYTAEDGSTKPIFMGCYGIGLGRVMGAVAEVHNDAHGLIWPEALSPYELHIVSLGADTDVQKRTQSVYEKLTMAGMDCLIDDRDERAGVKLSDADLIGIPHRIIISQKTGQHVEYTRRSTKETEILSVNQLLKKLKGTS